MGFSTSGATAILFIALLVSVSTIYPVLETRQERISAATDRRADRSLDRHNTDLGNASADYDSQTDTLTVTVVNTGTATLSVDRTDLLVDGRLEVNGNATVDGDADRTLWLPGTKLTIEVTGVVDQPDRVKVVTPTGVSILITEVT